MDGRIWGDYQDDIGYEYEYDVTEWERKQKVLSIESE